MTTTESGFTAEQLAALCGEPTPTDYPAWLNPAFLPADLLHRAGEARKALAPIRAAIDEWLVTYGPLFVEYDQATVGSSLPDDFDQAVGFQPLHTDAFTIGDALSGFVDAPLDEQQQRLAEAQARVGQVQK